MDDTMERKIIKKYAKTVNCLMKSESSAIKKVSRLFRTTKFINLALSNLHNYKVKD